MRKPRRYLAIGALSAALASLVAYAAQPSLQRALSTPHAAAAATDRPQSLSPARPNTARPPVGNPIPLPPLPPLPGTPTREEVGDPDSFGRPLKWLGVTQADIHLSEDCSLPEHQYEGSHCEQTLPAQTTSFSFHDTASITLPGNAAHSLLCYWFSPYIGLAYVNPGAEPVTASLVYRPRLTIESEVLRDPSLVDPSTGQPFGGRLSTAMTSGEQLNATLLGSEQRYETQRDSNVCIAGFLTRRNLVEGYGLTETQAEQVFRKPMTIRLDVSGSARYIPEASLTFGLRIVGD
ncbi:hypothetical protein CSC74_15065 [Pseudoxanthomonas yeongjuensis]|uniref:hypothetical protein n=1 Tax=Pseudoxanthomonas yeongjuensis TaxID=377616 RepID=UPI001390E46A|nr:hypothetical protein [Pseudoxanthomonas yeongjuensis]KAF1714955.1 hypothetical protein CSC74_15065 [Pseudoxanthomonas yeongjuensis]